MPFILDPIPLSRFLDLVKSGEISNLHSDLLTMMPSSMHLINNPNANLDNLSFVPTSIREFTVGKVVSVLLCGECHLPFSTNKAEVGDYSFVYGHIDALTPHAIDTGIVRVKLLDSLGTPYFRNFHSSLISIL